MSAIGRIFDQLGGPSAVARILDVGTSTASEMKRRRSIPVIYWPRLIEAAAQHGTALTYEALVEAHSDKLRAQEGAAA